MTFLRRHGHSLITLVLFCAAAWFLYSRLHQYRLGDIIAEIELLSPINLGAAVLMTAVCYLLLTGYDFFATLFIRKPLRAATWIFTSFVSFAFSNNISAANLTGAALRYRLYSNWGLTGGDVARMVIFYVSASWMGFLLISGIIFSLVPASLPVSLKLPFETIRPLGILFLALLAGLVSLAAIRKRPLQIRSWVLALPSGRLLLFQIAVAAADWAITGIVPFLLLPLPGVDYFHFLAVFLLAHMVAMISHVPGGLGVFESVMLLFLGPIISPPRLLASLVVYRIIYYLMPLVVAMGMLASFELRRKR